VPSVIPYLANLKSLALSYNYISDISSIFCENLFNLEILDASNNKIETIGEEIAQFQPLLSFLNFENNNIKQIPTIIGFLRL